MRLTKVQISTFILVSLAIVAIFIPFVWQNKIHIPKLLSPSIHIPLPPQKPTVNITSAKPNLLKLPTQQIIPMPKAWNVQLGSFHLQKNADELVKQLREHGYPAFIHVGGAMTGRVYQVLVGPQARRERAEAWVQLIDRQYQLKGIVVPSYPVKGKKEELRHRKIVKKD